MHLSSKTDALTWFGLLAAFTVPHQSTASHVKPFYMLTLMIFTSTAAPTSSCLLWQQQTDEFESVFTLIFLLREHMYCMLTNILEMTTPIIFIN
jgi:hypothetical protein